MSGQILQANEKNLIYFICSSDVDFMDEIYKWNQGTASGQILQAVQRTWKPISAVWGHQPTTTNEKGEYENMRPPTTNEKGESEGITNHY